MTEQSSQQYPAAAGAPTGWSGADQVPSPNVQATMHQMTEQLQTVIDAAERAAEAIRYDAEEQARRHLAEAQRKADRLTAERVGLISELTDDLVRHAANVRDHSEQMVRALEDAISSVTDKLEQPGMRSPFPGGAPVPAPAPVAMGSEPFAEHPGRSPEQSSWTATPVAGADVAEPPGDFNFPREHPEWQEEPAPDAPQEALEHAVRLAGAGEDRETIGIVLRHRFPSVDAEAILDSVTGGPGRAPG